MMCWWIHLWPEWSEPTDEQYLVTYNPRQHFRKVYLRTVRVQRRSCIRCGKVQESVIRTLGEYPASVKSK